MIDIKNTAITIIDVSSYHSSPPYKSDFHWFTFSITDKNKERVYKLTLSSHDDKPFEANVDHVSRRLECPYCKGVTPYNNECWGFNEVIDDVVKVIKAHPSIRLYMLFERRDKSC